MIFSRAAINGDTIDSTVVNGGLFVQDATGSAGAAVNLSVIINALLVMMATSVSSFSVAADGVARRGLWLSSNIANAASATVIRWAVMAGSSGFGATPSANALRRRLLSGSGDTAILAALGLSYQYLRPTAVQRIFEVLDRRKTFVEREERYAAIAFERRLIDVPADRGVAHEY